MKHTTLRAAASFIAAAVASPALATWSIILIDTRTGEIAVGSATCLTGFDLRAATPILIPGVGTATAQSFVDNTGQNRVFIRDRLALGVAPQDIITQLAAFDTGHQTRQYGIGDTFGRVATFSGTGAGQWAGGQTGLFASTHNGRVGHITYAIQGNVLTGSPVVTEAVTSAIATPGDLAAKLMASMQAARLMGGDGRCSCSQGNPTGCGSPPPTFTKSAHIAYMLIARTGDTEGSNGIYRAGSNPLAVLAANVTGDQRPDLIVANFSSNNLSVITNTSNQVAPGLAPIFSSLPTNYAAPAGPRALTIADVNGDMIPDVATASASANSVTVFLGTPAGLLTNAGTFAVGAQPRQVVVANFDGANGPDIATANFTANTISVLLHNGAGGYNAAASPVVDAGPVDLVAVNVVGSAAIDLVALSRTASRVIILRGAGDGTFTFEQNLTTNSTPSALVATDLDGDTDVDIAATTEAVRSVQFFRNDGAGTFTPFTYPLAIAPLDLAVGDVNGDTHLDIVACGGSSFSVFRNTGGGDFVFDRSYTIPSSAVGVALADLDGDGDLDGVFSSSGAGGAVTVKNLGPGSALGRFTDGLGCATGDYFMNFNVAFAQATDPDPVITLQTRYDQWRTDLIGRPDAVQSGVTFDPPYLPSVGAPAATMTITLRDWRNELVVAKPSWISVTPVPGSAPGMIGAIGPVQPLGESTFRVLITGGTTPGLARLRVRVDNGSIRPVVLMPEPTLSIYAGTCYPNCDASTIDPVLTANDFTCFIQKFALQDPYANCDATATFTANDYMCFIQQFATGCS